MATAAAVAMLFLGGCRMGLTKIDAIDRDAVQRQPLPGSMLEPTGAGEYRVADHREWFGDVAPRTSFVGVRDESGLVRYAQVVECDPVADRIVVRWLPGDLDPVALAAASAGEPPERSSERFTLPLGELVAASRFAPPIPPPGRVYAVVSNYPSHLEHDLRFDRIEELAAAMRRTRPRVFLKYPATAVPGLDDPASRPIPGAFDPLWFPARTQLPAEEDLDAGGAPSPTRLDYEVELGVVMGRDLTWEQVREMDDDALHETIAGVLLVSDVKARNPQVIGRAIEREMTAPEGSPYAIDDERFARRFGIWNESICRWWSHAASNGSYAALGPVFVAGAPAQRDARLLLTARSYAERAERGVAAPRGARTDGLYLRQLAAATHDPDYPDAMIWSVPAIIRSILDPRDNALSFTGDAPRLEAGDVIALGTPGGVVLTAPTQGLARFLEFTLFWFSPLDWHDAFFKRSEGQYLQPGDEVLFWGQGLGYQLHEIKREEEAAAP